MAKHYDLLTHRAALFPFLVIAAVHPKTKRERLSLSLPQITFGTVLRTLMP